MTEETYMDVPAVRNIANKFNELSNTVDEVTKTLEDVFSHIRDFAFFGAVGKSVYNFWSGSIKPEMVKFKDKMADLSNDVNGAIKAYTDGDFTGSQRFV